MHSQTEENYLKAIYKIAEKSGTKVSTNAIAERLQTKPASVTDMLKKLADKQLVDYEKYQGVVLTEKGKYIAVQIIRKHRLWEYFLVNILGFTWDSVHEIAEELEHINSTLLIDKLDAFLEYPQYDPHGDPIPNHKGEFSSRGAFTLATANLHQELLVTGVIDHSTEFLQYLNTIGLGLGTNIVINQFINFDKSLSVVINGKNGIFISHQVAKNLLVIEK